MAKTEFPLLLVRFAFLLACTPAIRADVVFSNLTGVYDTFGLVCTDRVFGCTGMPGRGFYTYKAEAFTPIQAYFLTDVQIPIFYPTPAYKGLDYSVGLYLDNNGVPGMPLSSVGEGVSDDTVAVLTPPPNTIQLSPFTQYWIVVTSRTLVLWEGGGGASSAPSATFRYPGDLFPPPPPPSWAASGPGTLQFQVDGTPSSAAVPEPASLLLLASALSAIILARIRRPQAGKH